MTQTSRVRMDVQPVWIAQAAGDDERLRIRFLLIARWTSNRSTLPFRRFGFCASRRRRRPDRPERRPCCSRRESHFAAGVDNICRWAGCRSPGSRSRPTIVLGPACHPMATRTVCRITRASLRVVGVEIVIRRKARIQRKPDQAVLRAARDAHCRNGLLLDHAIRQATRTVPFLTSTKKILPSGAIASDCGSTSPSAMSSERRPATVVVGCGRGVAVGWLPGFALSVSSLSSSSTMLSAPRLGMRWRAQYGTGREAQVASRSRSWRPMG